MIRFLQVIGVILMGCLVGLPVGYIAGHKSMDESPKTLSQVYALGEYETLASLQYQQASTEQGKRGLVDLLNFMDQLETKQGNAVGNVFGLDRDIARARLALLEEREDDKTDSESHMRQALEDLGKRSPNGYSETDLRDTLAKLDSKPHYALPGIFDFRQSIN